MGNLNDLTGKQFGSWQVLRRVANRYGIRSYYLCRCACGTEREIASQPLVAGKSQSCGCLTRRSYSFHGQSYSREYRIWQSMRNRCNNPNASHYARYGGRGIRVCARWEASFDDFLADVGRMPSPTHTLDRIDNDGNYEPGNIRWATRKEQAQNRHQARVSLANRKRDALGRLV
jgi:hypothetical protein